MRFHHVLFLSSVFFFYIWGCCCCCCGRRNNKTTHNKRRQKRRKETDVSPLYFGCFILLPIQPSAGLTQNCCWCWYEYIFVSCLVCISLWITPHTHSNNKKRLWWWVIWWSIYYIHQLYYEDRERTLEEIFLRRRRCSCIVFAGPLFISCDLRMRLSILVPPAIRLYSCPFSFFSLCPLVDVCRFFFQGHHQHSSDVHNNRQGLLEAIVFCDRSAARSPPPAISSANHRNTQRTNVWI